MVAQSEANKAWPPSTEGERAEYEKDKIKIFAYRSGGADNYIFETDVTPLSELIRLERDLTGSNNYRFYATVSSVSVGQAGGPGNLCSISTTGFAYSPGGITEFEIEDDASKGVKLNWLDDTNLYRYAAGVLGTDNNLQVDGEIRVGDNNNDDLVLIGGAETGSFSGTHTGSSGASTLTDSTLSLGANSLVGLTLLNVTDGSSGTITANTTNTISVSLSGGTDNDFDSGDSYRVRLNVGGSTQGGVITTKGTSSGSFHVGVEIPSNDANDGFYIATDSDQDGTVDTLALKIKANGFLGLRNNAPSARLTIGDGSGTTDHVYHLSLIHI